jgi:hypothetical protein
MIDSLIYLQNDSFTDQSIDIDKLRLLACAVYLSIEKGRNVRHIVGFDSLGV